VVDIKNIKTASIDEDVALKFNDDNGNRILITDVDNPTTDIQVTLKATNGKLTLGSTDHLTSVTGDNSANVVVKGTLENINNALDGLGFLGAQNFNGSANLTLTTTDLGGTGSGGAKTDSDTLSIKVNAVNDAPAYTYTTPLQDYTVAHGKNLLFNSTNSNLIKISDVDSSTGVFEVELAADHGTLTLAKKTGLSFGTGYYGTADSFMIFTGKLSDINNALNGMYFTPDSSYTGIDAGISLRTKDNGNAVNFLDLLDAITVTN
jgi:hypothetical protein